MDTTTFISVAVLTSPPSAQFDGPADGGVVGVAVMIAEHYRAHWQFSLDIGVLGSHETPVLMLERLADILPTQAVLIGWGLEQSVIGPLLEANSVTDAGRASQLRGRVERLLRQCPVDLALDYDPADFPDLATAAAAARIVAPCVPHERLLRLRCIGVVSPIRQQLEGEVLAQWRLFLIGGGSAGAAALAATESWLEGRRRIRGVDP